MVHVTGCCIPLCIVFIQFNYTILQITQILLGGEDPVGAVKEGNVRQLGEHMDAQLNRWAPDWWGLKELIT